MLRFAQLFLVCSTIASEPEAPAQGEALFQSSVRVYGRKSFTDRGMALEEDASDLLEEEPALHLDEVQGVRSKEGPQAKLTGLALLYDDLRWLGGLVSGAGFGGFDILGSLREFRADFLAWLTALVSFGLTRSLLLPMLMPAKKILETDEGQHEDEKVETAATVSTVPAVQPGGMEIKLDVTNPVMIQRAREQIEEAEKRAELIKNAQPDHRDVFGCTSLHLAAHNCHIEDVLQLLKRGFDVDAQDNFGDTALHMAARSNSLEIVKELLQHGADPARSNAFGKMAFAVATDRSLAQVLREAARKQPM